MPIWNRGRALRVLLLTSAAACPAAPAAAEVVLDGTVNAAFKGALDGGPDYEIEAEFGKQVGGNLFHSFERFGLRTGESATFSGPDGIKNVISRVTGGERSDIDGKLSSEIEGADFFFLNPAGVVFGPNATLDVKGSFHISTADELRFADGAAFSASDPGGSTFTMASPEAFGFLGAEPAGVAVVGGQLEVPAGKALSLVGGDVAVVGPSLAADNLRAPDGRIDLASAASPGEVAIGSDTVEAVSPARPGGIALNGASLAASGPDGGGRVVIRGGEIVIERSVVAARSLEDGDSAGVSIAGDGVRLDGGFVSTSSSGAGDAGPIAIAADRLDVRNTSFITSSSGEGSTGAGGDIAITVGTLDVSGGSAIITNTFGTGPSSRAGDLTVTASERVTVAGTGALADGSPASSQLSTGVIGDDSGDGGRLAVQAPRLEVGAGGVISGTTSGSGRGGDIDLAVGSLTVSGGGAIRTSTATGTGAAGDISVTAQEEVTVTGTGSTLETSTSGTKAPAGRIAVKAPRVEVSDDAFVTALTGGPGAGGPIDFDVGRLDVTGGAGVSASSQGFGATGPAGSVTVTASEAVTIADDGAIAAVTFLGSGRGGRVAIAAPRLDVTTGGRIATSTIVGTGDGGPIDIAVDRLAMTDGGFIQAATLGRGDAGDLTVTASESVTVAGTDSRLQASTAPEGDPIEVPRLGPDGEIVFDLIPRPRSTGAGGTVRIEAPAVRLADGGTITARSEGTGPAGDVVVTTPDRLVLDDASITTEATAAGGGRITVTVGELIDLRDSRVTTSVVESGSAGDGGDIVALDPRFLVLDDSVIQANAVRGDGGDVRIEVGSLFQTPDSVIEASSELGIDGTIAISAPDQDVTSGLVALPAAFVDASSLLRESCAARGGESAGSFVGVGKGGVAPGPEALLPGAYAGLIDATTGAADTTPRFEPVELVTACGGED